MYTYKRLRTYDLKVLKQMEENEIIYGKAEYNKGNIEHARLSEICLKKIRKVIKEKEEK